MKRLLKMPAREVKLLPPEQQEQVAQIKEMYKAQGDFSKQAMAAERARKVYRATVPRAGATGRGVRGVERFCELHCHFLALRLGTSVHLS